MLISSSSNHITPQNYHSIIIKLIKQCKTISQLHQLHAYTITNTPLSFHSSPSLLTKFLYTLTTKAKAKSSTSLLHYAKSIFNSIQNPSTFCYNTIIRVHTLLSFPIPALHFFTQMRRLSVPLDSHSFPFTLKACAQLGGVFLSRCLHCQVLKFGSLSDLYVMNSLIHGYMASDMSNDAYKVFDESPQRDVVSYNVLIDGFVKAGDVVKARELFDLMPVRDSVSWNTIIAGCAKGDYCEEAIELFDFMVDLEIRPDNVALVSTLSACAQVGELEKGKKIHDYIERNAMKVDAFLSTGLVDFYAKCGCVDIALKIFDSSSDKNLFTWNAMLVGLAMHGYGELLLEYFSRMIEAGVKPDGISILGVLVGCSHSGLVDEARKLFDEMESVYGVPREPKHYGCMADLLGRAGLIKKVMEMIKDMPRGGDMSVWSGLLGGCRIHGDVEIAEKAAKHLMELKPDDGGVYSILANVYANAERWEDVMNIRRSLSSNRVVTKIAGFSLIQLDGVAHEFIAGDSLHSESDKIYMVLNAIREHQSELS
ncbi:pentatricopeptide repeat-containing protein At5g61800 [Populus nigra]|uniref:pentatricopeptide repeat-containing protein At5g61800 n=1 Tax=Populus nigra TaxID=3691 RepID=UPI002B27A0DB|nr:pentatricopeptide repeat-containing protein At5g61800 [Populus nigra]XP_061956596.1 pentatricopeptide repeat-containing protein At5g61800 [Populus nigra]XP_061956597.1 pentatricopeptide repeat-containing protein At5g61800 [Populus nigra]